MVELVAAPHLGPQHPPRRHVAGAMGRAAAVLLSALAIVLVVVSQGRGGVDAREGTVAERLQEVRATAEQRPASLLQGHYVSNGKVHYFQEAAASPPASAYFNPAADQPEYRAASTSGLGFAGGGDPYRYIRTGHYAKILAAEHDVEQGWSNGTTYHALGAMKAIQGRMQELAQLGGAGEHADIKTRDEAILALLSAPVSASELRAALPALREKTKASNGSRKEEAGLRNLQKYIKESVDAFSAQERTKLESLSQEQLLQLKTNLIRSAAKTPRQALLEEEGHNVFAELPNPTPPTVRDLIAKERARAFALERKEAGRHASKQATTQKGLAATAVNKKATALPSLETAAAATKVAAPERLSIAKSAPRELAKVAPGKLMSPKELAVQAAAMQRFSDAYFGHTSSPALKRKQARTEASSSDKQARSWKPPARAKMAGLGAVSDSQSLLETKTKALEEKWRKKEREMKGTPLAPAKAKKGGSEEGGFSQIEAARKRMEATKKLAEEDDAQVAAASASVVDRLYQGDQLPRGAQNVAPKDNSFWVADQARKLSHMPLYAATRQTATKATDGYRSTPAMSDPYQYIRTGNYAKILSQEGLQDKTFTPTP